LREIAQLPEVMECYHMSGDFDFFLKLALKDLDAYNLLLMNKLSRLPDVGTMETLFVMSEVKCETGYVL
jgi:Lrp/AsnC family leucine-responsive transcriptional regulator